MLAEVLSKTREVLAAPEFSAAEKHDDLALVVKEIVPVDDGYQINLKPFHKRDQTVAVISRLWPPAAATSRARFTCS